jgi:hypothetical protein
MVQLNPQDIERPFARGTLRRMGTMVGRSLLLECPNCGSRGLLKNWFKMNDRCPTCGLRVEREGMAAAPFVLFPFSKLMWLAADLALRPAHSSELGVGEPGRKPT